ncbi:MAG: hypothetical protein ACRDSZ_18455 [Pseudonocardiaceae bacterium]
MPGSPVPYAKLYGNPDAVDTILTDHLPALLARWDEAPLRWFVRRVLRPRDGAELSGHGTDGSWFTAGLLDHPPTVRGSWSVIRS